MWSTQNQPSCKKSAALYVNIQGEKDYDIPDGDQEMIG